LCRHGVLVLHVQDDAGTGLGAAGEHLSVGGGFQRGAVLAWDALARRSPGRLRPCANDECRLFLIDHSKANAARWCSMAVCGNRMKARRHYQRARNTQAI
jgi:predicted RNA-binding Zn ribbon-like protein